MTDIIPEVYSRHLEEFAFLWNQRQTALHSPDHYLADVAALESKIEAHLDGLLLPGEAAVPVLEKCLEAGEPTALFAAAYVLLRLEIPTAAKRVLDLFLQAGPETIAGYRSALCHGPIRFIEPAIRDAARSDNPLIAAAATEILLFHRIATSPIDRVDEFLQHADPEVRRTGWRIVALRG